jgi:hypothetical protein
MMVPAWHCAARKPHFVSHKLGPVIERSYRLKKTLLFSLVATSVLLSVILAAPPHDFVPDAVFKGSSLTVFRTLGSTSWRAENGEITGTPKSPEGGWLVLDKSYQDIEFYAEFQCSEACNAGVLLRSEKTAGGGLKGTYISLKEGDTDSYGLELGADGKEVSRVKLDRATAQFSRIATGQWNNGQAHVPGFAAEAPTLAEYQASLAAVAAPAGGAGRGTGGPPRGGRGAAPGSALPANQWNNMQVIVDSDMVWTTLNGRRGFGNTATNDHMMGYGPVALYVGGSGNVKFREISSKDLIVKHEPTETVSSHFKIQRLSDFYYSWGVTVGDINHDGIPDVIAGPFYYLGPNYTERHEFTAARTYSPGANFPEGMVYYAHDFTGDGWPDLLVVDSRPVYLFVNPKGESRRWDRYNVIPDATSELELFRDIDGDGQPEVLYTGPGGTMCYAKPDPADPTKPWKAHKISEPGLAGAHGMGIGDLNGDGRMDVVNNRGWWEQPVTGAAEGPWKFHPENFGTGGAEMGVYDVNGDGLADVVTAVAAHGWGLAWFEQKRDAQGNISFVRHDIMGDFSTKNAGNVTFSELHAAAFADMDSDGIPDLITGKRLYSHLESHLDPDPNDAAVLYWYRTVRNPKAEGGAEFVPELIHNRSGVGSQFVVTDLNGDGAPDVVTSGPKGTFIFWNLMHAPARKGGK